MPVKVNCTQCGATLYRYPGYLRRFKNSFCDGKCQGLYYNHISEWNRRSAVARRQGVITPLNTREDAYIPLTGGKYAVVSPEDYQWLSHWNWYLSGAYAVREESGKGIYMHVEVMKCRVGIVPKVNQKIDHRNQDPLDNHRSNLRVATNALNVANSGLRSSNSSGYKGVSLHKVTQKWAASIRCGDRGVHLGVYKTREEAAYVYDQAALQIFGEFACTNFVYD